MLSEFFLTALMAVLKVTAFYRFTETLDTPSSLGLVLPLMIMESLTLVERTFPNNLDKENCVLPSPTWS